MCWRRAFEWTPELTGCQINQNPELVLCHLLLFLSPGRDREVNLKETDLSPSGGHQRGPAPRSALGDSLHAFLSAPSLCSFARVPGHHLHIGAGREYPVVCDVSASETVTLSSLYL